LEDAPTERQVARVFVSPRESKRVQVVGGALRLEGNSVGRAFTFL